MKRITRLLAGLALASAVLTIVAPTGRSPYASALTALTTGQDALAAPGCSSRTCDATGTRCIHVNGSRTDCGVGDFCRTHACL